MTRRTLFKTLAGVAVGAGLVTRESAAAPVAVAPAPKTLAEQLTAWAKKGDPKIVQFHISPTRIEELFGITWKEHLAAKRRGRLVWNPTSYLWRNVPVTWDVDHAITTPTMALAECYSFNEDRIIGVPIYG